MSIRKKEKQIDEANFQIEGNFLGRERKKAKEKAKRAAKKAAEGAKRAAKKASGAVKEAAEDLTAAVKKAASKLPEAEARYVVLFPLKGTMKKELDKRGVKYSNNLKSISQAFYKTVVKGSNLDEGDTPTDLELSAASSQLAKEEGASVSQQQLLQGVKDARQAKGGGIPSPSEVLNSIPDPTVQIAAKALLAKEKATGKKMEWKDAFIPVAIVNYFKALSNKVKGGRATPEEEATKKSADSETASKEKVSSTDIINDVLDGLIPVDTEKAPEKEQIDEEESFSKAIPIVLVLIAVILIAK